MSMCFRHVWHCLLGNMAFPLFFYWRFNAINSVGSFLLGLLTNCFILSALYNKTRSLWICAMTHALINTLSQISVGGNLFVSLVLRWLLFVLPFLFQEGYVKIMKKGAKTMLRVLLWIVAVIVILILICFVYHRYRLKAEKKLRDH